MTPSLSQRAFRSAATLFVLGAGGAWRSVYAQSFLSAEIPSAPVAAGTRTTSRATPVRTASDSSAGDSAGARSPHTVLPPWLAVNGYLTQAAATSRGGIMSGIPTDGTVDYRRAALLVRVSPTLADRFVIQVANRRLGSSPLAAYQPDVKLDWLFYEHAFGDATRARAGRIPIPIGISNETRYVGTLLPFYQAPTSVYREKEFSNEALDGGLISHEFAGDSPFSLEASLYGGAFRYVESSQYPTPPTLPPGMDPATAQAAYAAWVAAGSPAGMLPAGVAPGGWTYATARATARDLYGTTLWLTTPLPGFRVGAGALHAHLKGGLRPNGGVSGMLMAYASIDGNFDRFTVRTETLGANMTSTRLRGGYVQVGAHVAGPLSLNLQSDYSHFTFGFLPLPPTYAVRPLSFVQNRDHAASAVWAFRRNLQARLEGHMTRGYNAEETLDLTAAPRAGRYTILSMSAAF